MSDMKVSLVIDAVNKAAGPVRSVIRDMKKMREATDRAGQLKVLRLATSDVSTNLGKVTRQVGGLIGKLGLLGAAGAFVFKRQFVDTASTFEDLQVTLNALEGSSEKGKKALSWVFDFATKTPLSLEGAVEAFKSAKKFGIDPMAGSLQSLTDFNAKMGGGQLELSGIIMAVGQAWSKQKLQGEEALQLIERGVPVWDLLAKATGRTAVELQEMSSKGKLGRDVIKQLIDVMGDDAKGAALALTKTWSGMISNLGVHWTRFKLLVMQNGLFDWMSSKLEGLLKKLDQIASTGKLDKLARTAGEKIKAGFEKAWDAGKLFLEVLEKLSVVLDKVAGVLGGYENVAKGVALIMAGPLIASVVALVSSLFKLGALVVAFASGITLIPAAIVSSLIIIGSAIYKYWDQIKSFFKAWLEDVQSDWKTLGVFFDNLWDGIKQTFHEALGWIEEKIKWLSDQVKIVTELPNKLSSIVSEKTSEISSSISIKAEEIGGDIKAFFGFDDAMSAKGAAAPIASAVVAQRVDNGGTIKLEIISKEPVRVRKMKPNNPNMDFDVDTGISMAFP
ncbi:MAG: tape measure protein [Thiotrichaceae bacterium]